MKLILKQILFVVFLGAGQWAFSQDFQHFITRKGDQLLDGNKPFRFISFNVPTLNYQEDEMAYKETNPYALPNEFEMRDVFATVKEMGGQVIRIYTVPVRNKNFPKKSPTYVEGPGKFNEEAFKVTDQMLALANEYQIRIIFSLLNNRQWMGGRPNYADFRGKTDEDFWTDPQLIADFKQTLEHVVNRKNTITGTQYKDDKAILCWETGNELTSPIDWTIDICRYLKKLDKNHLVMDGYFAIDDRLVREKAIQEPSIDMVSSHHYERNPMETPVNVKKNLDLVNGRKVYLVGEFGFAGTSGLETVLDTVLAHRGICGALIWSLRHHRSKGGFYWHSEPLGNGVYKAYHWPGFVSGEAYDEINLLNMYRRKAFEIQGKEVPKVSIPQAPRLLPIPNVYSINWQGSTGASGYNIERATSAKGPWQQIAYNVSDADVPYFPLFHDQTAQLGKSYYYRVIALNASGKSKPSNVAGPVKVTQQALIDPMKNFGVVQDGKNVMPVSGSDRSYKEIRNRLAGDYGSEVTYKIPGKLDAFHLYVFEKTRFPYLRLYGSMDGESWERLDIFPEWFVNSEGNYAYWKPKIYTYKGDKDFKFIRVSFIGVAQLARTEILYSK